MTSRSAIVCLLATALAATACDRGSPGNGQADANVASSDEVTAAAPPSGQRADKVDRSHKGEGAPDVAFTTATGKPAKLADYRGKPLLVNLWATWCAPCVKEMPTLNAAAAALGDTVRVIAVSQDMEPAKATAFFAERTLPALALHLDPGLALSTAYAANLPTTILYGADGREIWRVTGDLDWTAEQAKGLLAEAR